MNLADIRKFTAQLAPRILIHGAEGVGKTTIASKFPAPIFLQTEDGCPSGLEINSFGLIDNFAELRSTIGALASEQHHYQTVVIDSLDATEELIWHDACRSQGWSSIESQPEFSLVRKAPLHRAAAPTTSRHRFAATGGNAKRQCNPAQT
jgi:predicted NACHT family NTPase